MVQFPSRQTVLDTPILLRLQKPCLSDSQYVWPDLTPWNHLYSCFSLLSSCIKPVTNFCLSYLLNVTYVCASLSPTPFSPYKGGWRLSPGCDAWTIALSSQLCFAPWNFLDLVTGFIFQCVSPFCASDPLYAVVGKTGVAASFWGLWSGGGYRQICANKFIIIRL